MRKILLGQHKSYTIWPKLSEKTSSIDMSRFNISLKIIWIVKKSIIVPFLVLKITIHKTENMKYLFLPQLNYCTYLLRK